MSGFSGYEDIGWKVCPHTHTLSGIDCWTDSQSPPPQETEHPDAYAACAVYFTTMATCSIPSLAMARLPEITFCKHFESHLKEYAFRNVLIDRYASRKAAQVLHGGGTFSNSGNRWFDKTLQVRGRNGSPSTKINIESFRLVCRFGAVCNRWGRLLGSPVWTSHGWRSANSDLAGLYPSQLVLKLCSPNIFFFLSLIICLSNEQSLIFCSENPDPTRSPLVPLPMPKKLYFHIDREIKRDIENAKQNLDM